MLPFVLAAETDLLNRMRDFNSQSKNEKEQVWLIIK